MKNNYCIILAGGAGRRLWPYSTAERPKQFLDPLGLGMTLLQLTYFRYSQVLPASHIFVSTFEGYAPLVRQQLPDLPEGNIVCEPVQLGTAPAAALAAATIRGLDPEANLILTPADQVIVHSENFREQMVKGLRFVSEAPRFLVLSVKATAPQTTFGYLQGGDEAEGDFIKVKSFTEKPTPDFARFFVDSGEFYWSTGLFLCSVQTLYQAMQESYAHIFQLSNMVAQGCGAQEVEAFIREQFPRYLFESLDLLLLERQQNVYLSDGAFGWHDIGTWQALYDCAQRDADGNAVLSGRPMFYNSTGNVVAVPPGNTLLLSDIHDCLVVEQNGVQIICRRDDDSLLRRMMNEAGMRGIK